MARKRLFLALVVVLVLGLTSIPGIASAEEGKAGLGTAIELGTSIGPLHPQYLSGGAWLAFTGQDPSGRLFWDRELNDSSSGGGLQAPGAAALIPYRSPAVKFSRNILLSQDRGRLPYQTEPHIAVNPKDPDHIVAALIDYNFIGVSNYVSIDGGATWDGPFQPQIPRGEIAGVGDPVVAFDREGNVYISQMSVSQQDFLIGGELGSAQVASVVISYSSDGGFTWERTTVASPGEVLGFSVATSPEDRPRGELWTYFVDKPWLTVGPNPDNPEEDILYITYTMFVTGYTLLWMDELPFIAVIGDLSVIELVRSEDGGRSWSSPIAVSPVTDLSGIPGRLVQGSQPAVDSDGTLYVAYWDSTTDGFLEGEAEIWVAASRDLGRTFYQRELAATSMELDFYPRVATFRLFGAGFPQLTIGTDDELYIAYTAYPEDEPMDGGNAYMVGSLDGGRTWAPPIIVNDDTTGGFQFYPSITVDPEGTLHMMWADTRDDPTGLVYHIYYSSSEDQGKTWELNSRVSDFPSNPNYAFPNGAFIGDYFSIKATSEDVYMVWPDSRLGEVTGVNQKIAFARKRLMPSPSIFLSPPSGSAGRDITIQGSNFQPESEIFIIVGGVLTSTGFTSQDGTFTITIFAPISGEGARDIVVSDISGNVALASFFTEFGFDTFQQSIGDIETRIEDIETPFGPLQQGIGDIETRLGTFQQSIANIETSLEEEEGFPWLATVLAGALVLALAAVATLWYRLRAVSQG